MARYSSERKEAVLKKASPLHMTISQVNEQEGISAQSLYNWRLYPISNNQRTAPQTLTAIMSPTIFTTTYPGLYAIFKPWIVQSYCTSY